MNLIIIILVIFIFVFLYEIIYRCGDIIKNYLKKEKCNNFPFKIYNFEYVSLKKFRELTMSSKPILFKNVLKNKIKFTDFCKILSAKPIKARYGNYGDVEGRKNRMFKDYTVRDLCNNINKSSQYGGNNVINEKEQTNVNLNLNSSQIKILRTGRLWIGPKGSQTPLHKDVPFNLSLQIYGRKEWLFFDVADNVNLCFNENSNKLEWSNYVIGEEKTCLNAKYTKMFKIVMMPGDMLFLPPQWAHQVRNLENSIMINYWFKEEDGYEIDAHMVNN